MQQYRPKVFFIGFNKTATTSLNGLFKDSGYVTYHNVKHRRSKTNLAKVIHENYVANKKLLTGLDDGEVFSDMIFSTFEHYIEANKYYRILDQQYPESYFILQTRNENAWIQSRLNHKFKPSFIERCKSALNINSTEELINYWIDIRRKHHTEVKEYFSNSKQFLEFNIDTNNIETLKNFVAPNYVLNTAYWKRRNVT